METINKWKKKKKMKKMEKRYILKFISLHCYAYALVAHLMRTGVALVSSKPGSKILRPIFQKVSLHFPWEYARSGTSHLSTKLTTQILTVLTLTILFMPLPHVPISRLMRSQSWLVATGKWHLGKHGAVRIPTTTRSRHSSGSNHTNLHPVSLSLILENKIFDL